MKGDRGLRVSLSFGKKDFFVYLTHGILGWDREGLTISSVRWYKEPVDHSPPSLTISSPSFPASSFIETLSSRFKADPFLRALHVQMVLQPRRVSAYVYPRDFGDHSKDGASVLLEEISFPVKKLRESLIQILRLDMHPNFYHLTFHALLPPPIPLLLLILLCSP